MPQAFKFQDDYILAGNIPYGGARNKINVLAIVPGGPYITLVMCNYTKQAQYVSKSKPERSFFYSVGYHEARAFSNK